MLPTSPSLNTHSLIMLPSPPHCAVLGGRIPPPPPPGRSWRRLRPQWRHNVLRVPPDALERHAVGVVEGVGAPVGGADRRHEVLAIHHPVCREESEEWAGVGGVGRERAGTRPPTHPRTSAPPAHLHTGSLSSTGSPPSSARHRAPAPWLPRASRPGWASRPAGRQAGARGAGRQGVPPRLRLWSQQRTQHACHTCKRWLAYEGGLWRQLTSTRMLRASALPPYRSILGLVSAM